MDPEFGSVSQARRRLWIQLSRNVDQPDHIVGNPIIGHKPERRPGSREIWLAMTEHDRVQVDSILIDQAKFGEAVRQVRAGNFDLPGALGLQLTNRALEIIPNKRCVGADGLQRARDDPFRLLPPRRGERLFRCTPPRIIVIPVAHDLIHLATVDTAGLPLSLVDEVAEERRAWRKCHMVDVAVQGLVHSKHELRHPAILHLSGRALPASRPPASLRRLTTRRCRLWPSASPSARRWRSQVWARPRKPPGPSWARICSTCRTGARLVDLKCSSAPRRWRRFERDPGRMCRAPYGKAASPTPTSPFISKASRRSGRWTTSPP